MRARFAGRSSAPGSCGEEALEWPDLSPDRVFRFATRLAFNLGQSYNGQQIEGKGNWGDLSVQRPPFCEAEGLN